MAVGGLSEVYESYFEDTDYCLAAREAGFRVLVCGDVTLVHDEHGSTDGRQEARQEIFADSRKVFARRWERKLKDRYRHSLAWQSIMN